MIEHTSAFNDGFVNLTESVEKPRPRRLLDLFCCSGVGAEGYQRAGFDRIFGVDIEAHDYPFWGFQRSDVLDYLAYDAGWFRKCFDAIHASPPCQAWTDLQKQNKRLYPRLIEPVRDRLEAIGLPYVIENVEGAPLRDPVMLCGTMFPGLRVLRHRLFESNVQLVAPPHGEHPLVFTHDKRKAHYGKLNQDTSFVQVTGGGNCTMRNARDAMGLPPDDRRTKYELNEGIPPAYTEHIGPATTHRRDRGTESRMICDGCNVREPFEHRCHDRGRGENAQCACEECRGADAFMAELGRVSGGDSDHHA